MHALSSNTSGSDHVAIGGRALLNNDIGEHKTATGTNAPISNQRE
jgi:hypothetical protein